MGLTLHESRSSLTHPFLFTRYGLMHRLAAFAFLILTSLTCVRAQSTDASLTGRVTDTAKALIIDARVAAISDGTNVRYETTTNSSGESHLGSLRPDVYRIEIEKTGFKKLM